MTSTRPSSKRLNDREEEVQLNSCFLNKEELQIIVPENNNNNKKQFLFLLLIKTRNVLYLPFRDLSQDKLLLLMSAGKSLSYFIFWQASHFGQARMNGRSSTLNYLLKSGDRRNISKIAVVFAIVSIY